MTTTDPTHIDTVAPYPATIETCTADALLRWRLAHGISHSAHLQQITSKPPEEWTDDPRFRAHLNGMIGATSTALALRALIDTDPERADQAAREIWTWGESGEMDEVLWDMAASRNLDPQRIADEARARSDD